MKFEARVLAKAKGGVIASRDGKLSVEKADELLLLIAGATSYRGGEPAELCKAHLQAAQDSYEQLRDRHVADHQRLFRRVAAGPGAHRQRGQAHQTSGWPQSPRARPTPGSPPCTSSSGDTC